MAPIQAKTKDEIWNQYAASTPISKTIKVSSEDKIEHFELETNDISPQGVRIIKYTVFIYGQQPLPGFPLFIGLHGGGKNTQDENNKAWVSMSRNLYGRNVENDIKVGVYIALRGIVDEWNLHFRAETYLLFQRLIRNLLMKTPQEAKIALPGQLNINAQHFINSNRVHLLGFSAGGDGVYRLSTVLSDRLAAVNMSAGHPGRVTFHNLANLPICLQVGEEDGDGRDYYNPRTNGMVSAPEYQRNERTVESATTLKTLQGNNLGSYVYDMFMHPTKEKPQNWAHNSWEHNELSDRDDSPVFAHWDKFRSDRTMELKNTCAVKWVDKKTRVPLSPFIVWDVSPVPDDQPIIPSEWGQYRFFYWLAAKQSDIAGAKLQLPKSAIDAVNTIRARYNGPAQWVWIEQTPVTVTILLNTDMKFDFTKPIKVFFGGGSQQTTIAQLTVNQYDAVQEATLNARGDPEYIFSATIVFDPVMKTARDGGGLIFSTTPRPSSQ